MRRPRTLLGAVLACSALACSPEVQVPGDEILGSFQMEARVLESGCQDAFEPDQLPATGGFGFSGILSRQKDTGSGYLTLNGVSRDGGFEGQVFTSSYSAPRHFEWKKQPKGCEGNEFQVSETLRLVLLSASQDQLLGARCPENPTTLLEPGGVPVDLDAGVVPPEARPEGYDAQRVCGFLIDVVTPAEACGMPACTVVYGVEGVKRQ